MQERTAVQGEAQVASFRQVADLPLEDRVRFALGQRVPAHIAQGSFQVAHAYVTLADELAAYLEGRRSERRAEVALARFCALAS